MWNLLKTNEECRRTRDSLEEAATKHADTTHGAGLIERLAPMEREHITSCQSCRDAAQDLVATKELFQGAPSFAVEARPWFAARVMNAIAAREREVALRISAWTEFPRFASRLAWITSIVLLAATTWFYESVVRAPKNQLNGAQESIFDAPQQQTTQDDILISMAADKP